MQWKRHEHDTREKGSGSYWALHMSTLVGHNCLSSQSDYHGVTIPNGIAWNSDETLIYMVETASCCLFIAKWDPANRRPLGKILNIVNLGVAAVRPDGIALDSMDRLWVACVASGKVTCCLVDDAQNAVTPIAVAAVPSTSFVTSCTFGGPGAGLSCL